MLVGLFMGFLSAIAFVIILARLGLRKFMGYPVAVDILGSALFCVLFAGTLTGMMVAVIAGLTLSGMVWLIRTLFGFEKWVRGKGWVYYPPRYMTA